MRSEHHLELPRCFLPHPARRNPRLDAARSHTKAWASDRGMLPTNGAEQPRAGPEIDPVWTEQDFDAMDFGLLGAYAHPDVSGPDLELLTDWYVWAYYLDDHVLQSYKGSRDSAGLRSYVERLGSVLEEDPVERPEPVDPSERGLADLWGRTAPTRSAEWRSRFADRTRALLDESLWELTNLSDERVPNPIEYVGTRRRSSRAAWAAGLVEHAADMELSAVLVESGPIRALLAAFTDAVCLRNDLFSYRREIEDESELHNAVLAVRSALECSAQQAAELVDTIASARVRSFEQLAHDELRPFLEVYEPDPTARLGVLGYVDALRDWQSGEHAWQQRSSRYADPDPTKSVADSGVHALSGPTGFGTSATKIQPVSRMVEPALPPAAGDLVHFSYGDIDLPDFYLPYPTRSNPHLDSTRTHASSWARDVGMLGSDSPWSDATFDAADFASFSASTHPDAANSELDLINDWHVWGWYIDDVFAETFEPEGDLAGARAYVARLDQFLPNDPAELPDPTNAVERGLADLWTRTAPGLSKPDRQHFPQQVMRFVAHRLWEIGNIANGTIPDPVEYLANRRDVTRLATTLVRYSLGNQLPRHAFDTGSMRALLRAFAEIRPLRNDIISYRKEVGSETGINNGVVVVRNFLGCEPQQAVDVVNGLADARVRQFEHVATERIPGLVEQIGPSPRSGERLERFVDALRHWLAGDLHWSMRTGRYDTTRTPATTEQPAALSGLIAGPTGLGTSAARLGSPRTSLARI